MEIQMIVGVMRRMFALKIEAVEGNRAFITRSIEEAKTLDCTIDINFIER